jgi:phosphate transport system substrate-binding protein
VRSRQWFSLVACASLAIGVAACGSSSSSSSTPSGAPGTTGKPGTGTITGAGSTLAAPVYQAWGSKLSAQGITLNYQPVGSGTGVQEWTAGKVDFGATDPALKPAEAAAAAASSPAVHIPTVLGGITISYNLPSVASGLKLDGVTAADIFLGKVKTWNDPEIAKLNAGVKLPSMPISVVRRSDSSGTTNGFTTFLSNHSTTWKSQIGAGKTVKWPASDTGAQGNPGVAQAIASKTGAIGYVEQAYALKNGFHYAAVKNKAGAFVSPTLASVSAAAAAAKVKPDLTYSAIDAPGATVYPIASQTFIVVHKDLCKTGVSSGAAKTLVAFLDYGLGTGQSDAQQISYAPLPASLDAKARQAVAGLTCNGAPVA